MSYTNLLMQNSIHSRKEIKTFSKKFERRLLAVQLSFFTRKAVVDETFIRKSANICKSIVGMDASQLYPYSMSHPLPTGLSARWDLTSETARFTPRQNMTRSFGNMIMSYFQTTRPECEIESFFTTGRQKKIDCFSVDGFFLIVRLCLKPWVAFATPVLVRSCVPLSLKKIFNVVARRESSMH